MAGWWAAAVASTRRGWCAVRRVPWTAVVTPMGWAALITGAGCAVLGWVKGWLELRGLGLLVAVLTLGALLLTLRRATHEAELHLHQPRVQAGQQGLGAVRVRGHGPMTTIELPVGKATARFRVGALRPGDQHEELFAVPTRCRGVVTIGPVRTVQADPVGLISRTHVLTQARELFVHPRMVVVDSTAIGFLKDIEGVPTPNLSSSDVSFHTLRDYVPGDDRRAVHWRTSARTGHLVVRQFEETMRAHLLVLLSTVRADYASEDDFEMAVSTAASLCVAALRDERQVTMYTSEGRVGFPSTVGLLDELCRVELTDTGPELREVTLRAGNEATGVSVASFITGGGTDAAGLRAAQLVLPPQIRSFAVRHQAGTALARRQADDLTILDLPSLEQLPMALRRLG